MLCWLLANSTSAGAGLMSDLDFHIREEAKSKSGGIYNLIHLINHGQVENWDVVERFWQQCIMYTWLLMM